MWPTGESKTKSQPPNIQGCAHIFPLIDPCAPEAEAVTTAATHYGWATKEVSPAECQTSQKVLNIKLLV